MLAAKVHRYIRERHLIVPGERISVAVSGGADSVALLRILLELQNELGVVLSIAHFNHRIRGAEADADEQFVKQLAQQFSLEFHAASADAPAHALEQRMSLETAARDLRHGWFAILVNEGKADKIATAHTQNDQAETVLMRLLRGAGAGGLSGISPWHRQKKLVRPLLTTCRFEVEAYLRALKQSWREDQSNRDLHHFRNRIRHELLPLLKGQYNPALPQTLADVAELARAEEEYWTQELTGLVGRLVRSGKPSRSGRSNPQQPVLAVDLIALRTLPLAVQRRLVRSMSKELGVALEFKHVQELLHFAAPGGTGKVLSLPGGLEAHCSHRELQISAKAEGHPIGYSYALSVPGQVDVAELGTTIRAQVVAPGSQNELSGYNSGLLSRTLLEPELTVRNWRAGDRFFPAHTRSPRKVKELLQPARLGRELSPDERRSWPVIESAGEIVWMRGFPPPEVFAATTGEAVLIQEVNSTSELG